MKQTNPPIRCYRALSALLSKQLRPGVITRDLPTFYQSALNAMERRSEATSHSELMAATAAYGAVIKHWHHMLIVHITFVALQGREVSRTNVRHWQKALFGKSIASQDLHLYAKTSRGAGDKVATLSTDDPASLEAKRVYLHHRDRLKAKVKSLI